MPLTEFRRRTHAQVNSEAAEAMATAAAADFRAWTLALARAVADGIFAPDNLAKALTLAKVDPSEASAVCFADSVWFAWLESEGSAAVEERKGRLADLGREALKASLVSKRLLMEIGEGDFMEECGLVVNYREGWRKKEIRANTRHVYTQRKFNLAREESEGYSKLVTLLNQSGAGSIKAAAAEAAVSGCHTCFC